MEGFNSISDYQIFGIVTSLVVSIEAYAVSCPAAACTCVPWQLQTTVRDETYTNWNALKIL